MKVVIVIPTYNEAENIGRIIDVLQPVFLKDPENSYHILVVDGNSPDGTGNVVLEKSKVYPNVELLLEKEKAGIGAGYAYAFKHAMAHNNPDVLVEMDADFQHNPEDVIRLVAPIGRGYDYVIGSRYTQGGSIPKEWAFYRKFLSIGGNIFSKIVLGIFEVNDFTTGFKASRVKGFVDKLDLDHLLFPKFAYKIDLLFRMHRLGAKVTEIPIAFGLRDRGNSKMEESNFMECLKTVLVLRINENKSFFKFLAVGMVGLAVDFVLFNTLRIYVLPSNISAYASGAVAMLTTFLLNNYWSFGERKIKSAFARMLGFVVYIVSSSIPIAVRGRLVAFAILWLGDTFLISNTAFFIGIIFGLIWNFTVYSKIIWKER